MQLSGDNTSFASLNRIHKMPSTAGVGWLALFSLLWGIVVARIPDEPLVWIPDNGPHHHSQSQSHMVYLGAWGPCTVPEPAEGSVPAEPEYYVASRDHIDPTSHVEHIIDSFVNINAKGRDQRRRTSRPLKGLAFEPRVGEQSRVIECRDLHSISVDMTKCLPVDEQGRLPARVQSCIVTESCAVSEWSEWRPTSTPHQLTRTRTLISLPQGANEHCGPLQEFNTIITNSSDQTFAWAGGNWGPCLVVVDDAENEDRIMLRTMDEGHYQQQLASSRDPAICGGGTQKRDVTCISTADGRAVPDHMCHHLQPIVRVQRCEVQCPRDCQMSEWSDWGPCQPIAGCPMSPVEELTTSGFRTRVRRIVVAPARGGAPCGALEATQPCARFACERWRVGAWGACELKRPPIIVPPNVTRDPRVCGDRERERPVDCVAPWGSPAAEWKCAGAGVAKPASREPCRRACPGDCVVSAWGEWSACSRKCAGHGPDPPTRHRNRTIMALRKHGGFECPSPEQMHQTETCNEHACHSYTWLTLPWGPCIQEEMNEKEENGDTSSIRFIDRIEPLNKTKTSQEDGNCGTGRQYRDVWCMEDNDRRVKDSHCSPIRKSEVMQKCKLPCPQDCVLSEWGPWSDCPSDCTTEPATQVRRRFVVESAARGGAACGAREQRRDCAPPRSCRRPNGAADRALAPHWAHGDWSGCVLPATVRCGEGYMTRAVWCSSRRHKLPPSACATSRVAGAARAPPGYARCTVNCSGDARCALSDWSDWSPCPIGCGHVSTRSRRKLEGSGPCPSGVVLHEGRECPCRKYKDEPIGTWSQCILNEHQETAYESANDCGRGYLFQSYACVDDTTDMLVESHLCSRFHLGEKEYNAAISAIPMNSFQTVECQVPCPVDCEMSHWGVWSSCGGDDNIPKCGIHLQSRTRNILVNASNGGRACGPISQTQVCVNPCDEYTWSVGPWLPCYITTKNGDQETTTKVITGCGAGEQFRDVRCIEKVSGSIVQDPLCDYAIQPERERTCEIACPSECVLSEWSEWSICEQPCNATKRRDRTRALLRAGEDNASCGPTVQAQPCIIDVTCYQYAWRNGPWSDCEPLGGSPCGEGIKRRPVYCERSDGRQVDESLCKDKVRPTPAERFCYVECPIDCSLSEWSEWQKDSCTCSNQENIYKSGYMTRRRYILTMASSAGRQCPNNTRLQESVKCPKEPCHLVKTSPYSACILDFPGLSCGYGKRRREVSCVRDTDGGEVPPWYCDLDSVPMEEVCFVECSSGCRASAWGAWSGCDAEGVRYRKRVSYRPSGPPCADNVLRYEVFEYANCNVTENELTKDLSEWSTYDGEEEDLNQSDQDDYYVHTSDQPEKTYLLFRGKRLPDEHAALIAGLSCATLVALLMILYAIVRYHKQKTVHKV